VPLARKLDSLRNASLLTRTLLTVVSLVTVFSLFIAGVSVAVVSATKAVFPRSDEQSLASPSGASEADSAAPTAAPKTAAKQSPASRKSRGGSTSKTP